MNILSLFIENWFEKCLVKTPQNPRIIFLEFRTTNHRLPEETGRWIDIPYKERFCTW
jgi:hypothetical protein